MYKIYIDFGFDHKEIECTCFDAVSAEIAKLDFPPKRVHIIYLTKI